MIEDVRDERLAEALDAAVRHVEPEPARWSPRVMRRGSRRRAARWTAIVAAVAVFVGVVGWGALQFRRTTSVGGDVSIGSLDTTGWTLSAPSSWRQQDLPACPIAPARTGVILTTTGFEFRNPSGDAPGCEDRYVFSGFPSDGVALSLQPVGVRIGIFRPGEDTRFPLTLDRLRRTKGIRGGPQERYTSITVDGDLVLILRTWVGPSAPRKDFDELASIVRSLEVAGAIRWTTYRNDDVGFGVTYPEGWIRADTNLTPALSQPHEILSLGTYPLRSGGKACIDAYLPGNALEDLGPNDVLLTVQESDSGPGGFPPRPGTFEPSNARVAVEDHPACDEYARIPMRGWWFAFEDQGRNLYAFLAVGGDVTPESEAWRTGWGVLNGLHFDPNSSPA
jgi:hypothetical protein